MAVVIFITIGGVLVEAFKVLNEASIYLLAGLLLAGVVKVIFKEEKVYSLVGGSGVKPVVRAALFGIPLPLCSCGVVPMALSMRRQGSSRGASLSFLISTPETGADSIAISYALLGPVFAIFRPLAALVTAVVAGLWADALKREEEMREPAGDLCQVCELEMGGNAHLHTGREKMGRALYYAFDDFFGEIAGWLFFGILLAGVVTYIIPENFFGTYMGAGLFSMLVMLAVGIPVYICASASTPVAAALMLRGLNPGAALVFLLAGPATNVSTIIMVGRYMGKRVMVVYLVVVCVVSVLMGYLLNILLLGPGTDYAARVVQGSEFLPLWLKVGASLALMMLFLRCLAKRATQRETSLQEACCEEEHQHGAGRLMRDTK